MLSVMRVHTRSRHTFGGLGPAGSGGWRHPGGAIGDRLRFEDSSGRLGVSSVAGSQGWAARVALQRVR